MQNIFIFVEVNIVMELMVFITGLCISFSFLQTPSSLQIQLQSSHKQANEVQLSPPTLPRKLRVLTAEVSVKGHAAQEKMAHNNPNEDVPAGKINRLYNKEEGSKAKGPWQEWVEKGGYVSEYFTMDYSHVKRRRPIHNKSLPAAP